MHQAIDMEYCMIVIEKLISPNTPIEQVEPLLRDLMDSVYHPKMKELAQRIVDPELDISQRRKLKEEFRNFDHGGANDYSDINYKELIDKLLDPNLPDLEYKPTMKALLDGDLDQDKKNMVSAIISCQNKDQKAKMVKRFKSLFDREKEEKEKAERERAEAKAAKERAKAELEANLLKFDDDGMTLIYKLVDKKIPREKKTDIYERLMGEDIDADIKNLAIQILNKKAAEYPQLIEDFKKRREEEKIAALKKKEEDARRKAEEEKEKEDFKQFYSSGSGQAPAQEGSGHKPHPERIAPLRDKPVTPVEKTHRGAPIKRSKWHLGIRSQSKPHDIMSEVYRAMKTLDFEWKVINPYHVQVSLSI